MGTEAFADWLKRQLEKRGWGSNTLARKIDPAKKETVRRALLRYKKGAIPSEPYAQAIADAFGIPREQVPVRGEKPLPPFQEAVNALYGLSAAYPYKHVVDRVAAQLVVGLDADPISRQERGLGEILTLEIDGVKVRLQIDPITAYTRGKTRGLRHEMEPVG